MYREDKENFGTKEGHGNEKEITVLGLYFGVGVKCY